jgi:hypothetical protein
LVPPESLHPAWKSKWQRRFFYRKEVVKLKWRLRLLLLLVLTVSALVTRHFWSMRISESLTCREQLTRSDLIVVENIDPSYMLFERAAALRKAGFASRVLVPVQVSDAYEKANAATLGIAELMARLADLQTPEIMPIRANEPISLNAAYKVKNFLTKEHLRSVIVVTSGFRSKRSALIYEAVLAPAGITVSCVPVFVGAGPRNWSQTWHGIQEVIEQTLKLEFYRFYVLLKPVTSMHGADCEPAECQP